MGPTPAKVGRIKARDTQTTWPDPWSIATCKVATVMDLGSVNAPPPLEHRQSGVGWSSERSEREKKKVSSWKLQASSLTAGLG